MTSSRAPTDGELLQDVASPEAFAVFYRRHAEAVLRYLAIRGADIETAADITADTFIVALKGRTDYRPEHDSARLWLLGIASRKLVDGHRRRARDARREQRLRGEVIVLTQRDRTSFADYVSAADSAPLDALADLPPLQRQAIQKRVLEDHSYAEVARGLGVSEQATRKHVSRGLAALRTQFGRTTR